MKKLLLVIAALVLAIGIVSSAVTAVEDVGTAAAISIVAAAMLVVTGGVALVFSQWTAKKGHPRVDLRSVKAINAAVLMSMMVANTRYDLIKDVIATSPKVLIRQYRLLY